MNDINLDNPIFVYYINVQSYSPQYVDQMVQNIKNSFPSNITLWVVPCDYTKIECVFDGWKMKSESLKKIYTLIEEMDADNPNFGELKRQIREILLIDIING
jgi:hypothetical protein